jgi:hypothetical protein
VRCHLGDPRPDQTAIVSERELGATEVARLP